MSQPLILLGASVRAAGESARRAGFAPWTADLFADADLRALVPNAIRCPVDQYPAGFRHILRTAPDAPWVYTGGLENHPNLVRSLSELRPLWGNAASALAACRSPFTVESLLRAAGMPAVAVRPGDTELPVDGDWLRKSLTGTAGHGIGFAVPGPPDRESYLQRFVVGPSYSAIFVRARGDVRLLGVTEQLVGPIDWLNAPAFRYAGSLGPVRLEPPGQADLRRIGRAIGDGCGLLGLFGTDFILRDGRPYVVEVNPRYTASTEVLERATGLRAFAWHRLAFDPSASVPADGPPTARWYGKVILYATTRFVVPATIFRLTDGLRAGDQAAADIPHAGEVIEPGWPILTLLAAGETNTTCRESLQTLAVMVSSALGQTG